MSTNGTIELPPNRPADFAPDKMFGGKPFVELNLEWRRAAESAVDSMKSNTEDRYVRSETALDQFLFAGSAGGIGIVIASLGHFLTWKFGIAGILAASGAFTVSMVLIGLRRLATYLRELEVRTQVVKFMRMYDPAQRTAPDEILKLLDLDNANLFSRTVLKYLPAAVPMAIFVLGCCFAVVGTLISLPPDLKLN